MTTSPGVPMTADSTDRNDDLARVLCQADVDSANTEAGYAVEDFDHMWGTLEAEYGHQADAALEWMQAHLRATAGREPGPEREGTERDGGPARDEGLRARILRETADAYEAAKFDGSLTALTDQYRAGGPSMPTIWLRHMADRAALAASPAPGGDEELIADLRARVAHLQAVGDDHQQRLYDLRKALSKWRAIERESDHAARTGSSDDFRGDLRQARQAFMRAASVLAEDPDGPAPGGDTAPREDAGTPDCEHHWVSRHQPDFPPQVYWVGVCSLCGVIDGKPLTDQVEDEAQRHDAHVERDDSARTGPTYYAWCTFCDWHSPRRKVEDLVREFAAKHEETARPVPPGPAATRDGEAGR